MTAGRFGAPSPMDKETLFARLVIRQGAGTAEQVAEAMAWVERGKADSVGEALRRLQYLTPDQERKILELVDRTPEDELLAPLVDDEEAEGIMEVEYGGEDEGAPAAPDPDDASGTRFPILMTVCTECGAEVTQDEIDAGTAFLFFGEAYCGGCAEKATHLFRLQDARHARASRKLNLFPTPPPAPAPLDDPAPAPEPPQPPKAPAERRRTPSSRSVAAARPPENPPPLPRAGSMEEIPEAEIQEIEKLLSRDKRDLARSRLARILACSPSEAETALKKLEEDAQKSGGGSRGILGFARALARSTTFHLNARRGNWARVIEDGESWLADDPDNVDVLTILGTAYRETHRADRAERVLRKAVEKAPATPEPLRILAGLLADLERWHEALGLYRDLLAFDPKAEEALRGIVRCAGAAGCEIEALDSLEALVEADPPDVLDMSELRVAVLYRAGRLDEAWRAMPDLLRREGRPYDRGLRWAETLLAENPRDAKGFRQLGRILERRGQEAESYAAYRNAAALSPDDPRTVRKLGDLAARLGRTGEAIERYESLVFAGETDPELTRALASMLRQSGRLEDAAIWFKASLETGEADAAGLEAWGRVLLDLGRFEEAEEAFRAAQGAGSADAGESLRLMRETLLDEHIEDLMRDLGGGPPAVHLKLARRFLERGLESLAVSQAMEAVSPGDPESSAKAVEFLAGLYARDRSQRRLAFFLAAHYRGQDQMVRAAEVLARYAFERPEDPEGNRTLLSVLLDGGMPGPALDLIERLLPYGKSYRADVQRGLERLRAGGVDDLRVSLFLGRLRAQEGDPRGALDYLREYLAREPDKAPELAADMLALAEEAGDEDAVVEWGELTLESGPDRLLLALALTDLHFGRGRMEDAERHVTAVLGTDPKNRTALAWKEKLDARRREVSLLDLETRFGDAPDDTALGIELGKALLAAGRADEGVRILTRCRADRESGWKAMEALYSHYRAEGDFRRALASLKELMPRRRPRRESREWKEITYRMGDLYLSLADPVRAGRAFFDIFKTDPKFRDVKQMMELVAVVEELVDPSRTGGAKSWHLGVGGAVEGPLDLAGVKERIEEDRLSPNDLAWRPGFSGWKRAGEADTIALLFKYRDRL